MLVMCARGLVLFGLVGFVAGSAAARSVSISGSFRTRLEAWDWFDGRGDSTYAYSGNLLRVSIGQTGARFDWQFELAAPFLLGLPRNAIAPAPQGQLGLGATYFAANDRSSNAAAVFPKQAFVRLKDVFGAGHMLRLGRFEFLDGSETTPSDATLAWLKRERIVQRLIGNFGWSHVQRSYDGAHYGWNGRGLNVTAVAALPTRGVFQTDGWGNLKTAVVYGAVTGQVGGKPHAGEWRLLGIYYHDWRRGVAAFVQSPGSASIRIGTYGANYIHTSATRAGQFDALLWAVGQAGSWGSREHRAWAFALEGGWQPPGLRRLRPWLRAGINFGSGDDNPADQWHGTFFQILPTPRPYARFPFFNMMNLRDEFIMAMLRPHRSVTVRTEARDLSLSNRNDLWYSGGGAFQPWTLGYAGRPSGGNHGLANLYDISVDYQAGARATVTGYYGFAAGRLVTRNIYPDGKNAGFAYLEVSYRF